ncbi:MAG TPA: LysM peptidoglycan-binding domain-containing M23 family metallopeptidase [Spirochaetota bacterium]|nr:LysM peptidoglycan-binding domain-containing M23 family metallopeptidase [Spirochaetota bacterium]HOH36810.1 LysM peptidoglycan-binding domain-containing M23 family metallopeptidase [Spirochaetota bacterium]HPY01654.1 LysM peptidoglycan-binding domain-containing M23 family metallopeptidase [Spirochaetota bacterium]HQA51704.1 LysM peptidoglycan-binding domain-containing M23 family metallopeptidase [Spirochaetota bacterium]
MKKLIFIISALFLNIQAEEVLKLESLDRHSPQIKSIRQDAMKTIKTIKSLRSPDELPELKFYEYTIKQKDDFFGIIASTGTDLDTVVSVNKLSGPKENSGKTIYIPNMRGIIHHVKNGESIDSISLFHSVPKQYILKVNKITTLSKTDLFIPMGRISSSDRQKFLNAGFTSPIASKQTRLTSSFGTRKDPFTGEHEFHEGIDLACPLGTPVRTARDGIIVVAGNEGGYGNLVVVRHSNGYETYYGHLSKFLVKEGQRVKKGDIVALSGNTGRTTGPHLHYEIRKNGKALNPKYFAK